MLKISLFKTKLLVLAIFFLAAILRFSVLLVAHHGDLNNNISWGQIAYENGLRDFYGSSDSDDWPYSAPNQPPLTIINFAVTANFWHAINDKVSDFNWRYRVFPSKFIWFWEENGWDLLIKLPSLIADLGIGLVIYWYLRKKKKANAMFIASLWLFNPLTWYNSSVWGQTDSIVNLFGLIAIINLLEKKLVNFSFWFTLSFLYKGSLGVFIPFLIYIVFKQSFDFNKWVKSIITVAVTVFIVGIWFHPSLDYFIWLVNLYKERILPGEIGYLTANAFNFWWLINPGEVLDSTIYFGLSARVLGIILTLSLIILVITKIRGKLDERKILFGLAASALIAFIFMTRIHPRYLYPFFPLATILLAYYKRLNFSYWILSFVHLANIYYLFWIPDMPVIKSLYNNLIFTNSLSLIFLLNLALIFQLRFKSNYKRNGKQV